MRSYQLEALGRLVDYAYENTVFYREFFGSVGFKPGDIKSFADFERLPSFDRVTVDARHEDFKAKDFERIPKKLTFTSGTSGNPLKIYRSMETEFFRQASGWRWKHALGIRYYDRSVDNYGKLPLGSDGPTFWWDARENCWFYNLQHRLSGDISGYMALLRRVKPVLLNGPPSHLMSLAIAASEAGEEKHLAPLIITGGELLTGRTRKIISEMFGSNIYDYYANRENTVGARQLEPEGDYLIDAESCYLEFVDEKGKAVAKNEVGQVVSTSLHNRAFPLIRYRTGDLASPVGYRSLRGFNLPALRIHGGRGKDLILTRDGLKTITMLHGFDDFEIAKLRSFRIKQLTLDELELQIAPGPTYSREHDEQRLRAAFSVHVPPQMSFSIRYIDHLTYSNNFKIKLVESQLATKYLDSRYALPDERNSVE